MKYLCIKATMFSQVFIITVKTPFGVTVPCAFFLCPDKELDTYRAVFASLKEQGIDGPQLFYCDFEMAIIKGMKLVFDRSEIRCCDTHFKRAIRSNIQHHHLMELYNNNNSFQQFIRHLWSLSLVPTQDIVRVWTDVVLPLIPHHEAEGCENDDTVLEEDFETWDADEDDVNDFIEYFERTWVGRLNQRNGLRKNPRYHFGLWSKYETIKQGDDTTTNSIEGFNNAISLSIPRNASIWSLIHQFKTEESVMHIKLKEGISGVDKEKGKRRSKDRIAKQEALRAIVNNYDYIPIKDYISNIVGFFNM